MKHLRIAVALGVAVTLGVAACGSPKSSDNGNNGGLGSAQNVTVDPNAKGPAPAVPGAKTGGTITVKAETIPSTFDPTDIYYVDTNEIGKLLFRTPTQFVIRNGKPVLVPDLTDLGVVSADKLTWTFTMKTGLKYEDGSEIKVEDLAYSVKRMMDNDAFQNGPKYQFSYFKGKDTYKGPYLSGPNCECVETQGTDKLIIHLATPFPDLNYYTTFPAFSPIPEAKDNKAQYKNRPISTGPYMIDSYTPGVDMKLKRNPNWDANSDPARHAYPDRWEFAWGGNAIQSQTAILNGTEPTTINYDSLDSTLGDKAKAAPQQFLTGDSPCTIVTNLDTRKLSLEVRKAIAAAYPYDKIWKAAGLSDLTAQPASTILPPAVPGYTKYELPGLNGTGNGDPAKAKQMLTDANALGTKIIWYVNAESPVAQQVSDIRKEALEAAGFTTQVIPVPAAKLREVRGDYKAPANLGQTPAGWCSDWPSGGSWFPVLFRSQSVAEGQSWGMLADPALDQKINDISNLPANEQTAAWGALDKEIMEKYLPALPLYYDKAAMAYGTGLGAVTNDPTVGMPYMLDMYVK